MNLKKTVVGMLTVGCLVASIGTVRAEWVSGIEDIIGCYKENCANKRFSDLMEFDYLNYKHIGVEFCLDKGIMNGTGEDTFSPAGVLTRGQLATMLYRYEGSPAVTGSSSFTDLREDWYKPAIAWAASVGIVNGTSEDTFSPYDPITGEQLATIFYRYAKSKGYDTTIDNPDEPLIPAERESISE